MKKTSAISLLCLFSCVSILRPGSVRAESENSDLSFSFRRETDLVRRAKAGMAGLKSEADSARLAKADMPGSKPWMFFDLGEKTLLSTEIGPDNELANIHFMPGAREYLETLAKKGYKLGLLVNFDEGAGPEKLKEYVAFGDRWTDPHPLDWALFNAGIFTSMTVEGRKPGPHLFEQAVALAASAGGRAVYQGSLPEEIEAARNAGMAAYHVGDPGKPFYLPESDIARFAEQDGSSALGVKIDQSQPFANRIAQADIPRLSAVPAMIPLTTPAIHALTPVVVHLETRTPTSFVTALRF